MAKTSNAFHFRSPLRLLLGIGTPILLFACTHAKHDARPCDVSLAELELLDMSYEEASAIGRQHLLVPPLFKIVADSIEIVKKDKAGLPIEVVAEGQVFVDMSLKERATGMCDRATVKVKSAELVGRPIIKRSNRIARGTSQNASFAISEENLKAKGSYQLATLDEAPLMNGPFDETFPQPLPLALPTAATFVASTENVLLPAIHRVEMATVKGTEPPTAPAAPSN
jgi:hypothetical protein